MTWAGIITYGIIATSVFGAEPSTIDKIETEWSPRTDIVVQYCFSRDLYAQPTGEQIWLVSTSDFSNRRLLFANERSAKVLFADDEEWLAVNDHWGSNGSSLILYKKSGELDYRKQIDLTGEAWDFFCKQQHITDTGFDHAYVDAIRWTTHPRAVILELHGHLDPRHRVDKWFCIYYVDSKKFSTAFDALNKEQVVLPDKR